MSHTYKHPCCLFLLLLDEADIPLTAQDYTNKTVFLAAAEEISLCVLSKSKDSTALRGINNKERGKESSKI